MDISVNLKCPDSHTPNKSSNNVNCDPSQGNAYYLLSIGYGPYQPTDIDFPKHGERKFRTEWYNSFPWLEYSSFNDSV